MFMLYDLSLKINDSNKGRRTLGGRLHLSVL